MHGSSREMIADPEAALAGDPHPVLAQLGWPDGASAVVQRDGRLLGPVVDAGSLERFLRDYHDQLLVPAEWPAILQAHRHAVRGEVRELIALDRKLATEGVDPDLVAASCRVGQRQLSRLRALRDQRVIQRYLSALDAGEARGWHTLVYGVSLAVFALPLRQGLMNYAGRTIGGFVAGAARSRLVSEARALELEAAARARLPDALESVLARGIGTPALRLV